MRRRRAGSGAAWEHTARTQGVCGGVGKKNEEEKQKSSVPAAAAELSCNFRSACGAPLSCTAGRTCLLRVRFSPRVLSCVVLAGGLPKDW